MRKVIVFKVENVLVSGFDERRNDELNAKRVVRELVGDEFFEREFVNEERKNGKVVRKVVGLGEMRRMLEEFERTGGKMVFVSGERRNNVEKLLWANGLREYEVESDFGFLEGMEEKDYVVFDSVESLDGMWGKIGLKRG